MVNLEKSYKQVARLHMDGLRSFQRRGRGVPQTRLQASWLDGVMLRSIQANLDSSGL
jgi:hypothetical protein